MNLNGELKIRDLLETYPFLKEFLVQYNPKFALLNNRAMLASMGRIATLQMVATMGGVPLPKLLQDLQQAIRDQAGVSPEISQTDAAAVSAGKIAALKSIIEEMHQGGSFEAARERFNVLLKDVAPEEIKDMEEQLLQQGMPSQEIQKLCDLHVGVFKQALDQQTSLSVPAGHPVHTYQQENLKLQAAVEEYECLLRGLAENQAQSITTETKEALLQALERIAQAEKHYVRKENQLFPYMEKHGVTAPPKVMWGVHDEIRAQIKKVRKALATEPVRELKAVSAELLRSVTEMVYKEEKIMLPLVLKTFTEQEWQEIRAGEDSLGYILGVKPGTDWVYVQSAVTTQASAKDFTPRLALATGQLGLEQIDLLLRHLPLDISFVDDQDEVRYYSEGKERIFPRSPGVIGRKVQNCHPPKSVHIVEKILAEFRKGTKDQAEFWISMQGKKIYIQYLAVRDAKGRYQGTLEITQDITHIQSLTGDKRLLDWEQA